MSDERLMCKHVQVRRNYWVCTTCQHPAHTDGPPKRICGPWEKASHKQTTISQSPRRALAVQAGPCANRGEVLDTATCQLCGAKGQLYEIFACSIYGKCSLSKRDRNLKTCVGCGDFAPIVSLPTD